MLAVKRARRRAALAALCVFAVALAAALFPAGGFGSQPAGVGAGGTADAPAGGPAPDPASDPPTATTPTDSGTVTTDSEPATTAEPTTERTETTTAGSAATPATGDSGPGAGALFGALFALAGVVTAVGLWTGALAVTATTAGAIPFTLTVGDTPIGSLVGRIPSRTMALVVGLSASVPGVLDDAAALSREVATGLSTAVGGLARATGSALRIGAEGLGATVAAVPRALAGLGTGASLLSRVGGAGLPRLGLGGRDRDGRAAGGTVRSDSDGGETGPPSVEEAWRAMTERVRVRNRDARTPGEFARAAVERGYPDDAVARLTDAFREVRYGDLPRADRTSAARSALDRIRRDREGDDE